MKKFSIIIPAYNCEKYISNCLESIKNQTFTNYEIIIINDNSTDATGIKIDSFIRQNPRVDVSVIYNNANLGVSKSRNLGLKKASGEFILFADADDYYCNNQAFEHFNSRLNRNTDILIFGCNIKHLGNNDKPLLPTFDVVPKEKNSIPKHELFPFNPLKTVWQICCRKDFLSQNNIFFQEDLSRYEDMIFRQQAVAMSKKISTTDEIAYTWNRRFASAKSLTINKNNNCFGELKKLVGATRRIGELSRQYGFPPETQKRFKNLMLLMPVGVFYVTTMSLFYKMNSDKKDRNIEKQDNNIR